MCDGGGELHQAFTRSAAQYARATFHPQQMFQGLY